MYNLSFEDKNIIVLNLNIRWRNSMFKNRREPNRNEQRNLQNSPHGPSNSQFTSGTTNVEFARESRFNKPRENQSRQRNNNNQNVDRVEFAREFDDDCCDRSSRDDRSEKDTPNEGESLEARDRNDSPYYDVT